MYNVLVYIHIIMNMSVYFGVYVCIKCICNMHINIYYVICDKIRSEGS